MAKEDIPGLVLHVKESALTPCLGDAFKANGDIRLTVEVSDLEVWDKVVEKLDGLVVYSKATLPEILIEIAQRRADQAHQTAAQAAEDARTRVERLEAELAFERSNGANLQAQLTAAHTELEVLRAFEETMNKAHA